MAMSINEILPWKSSLEPPVHSNGWERISDDLTKEHDWYHPLRRPVLPIRIRKSRHNFNLPRRKTLSLLIDDNCPKCHSELPFAKVIDNFRINVAEAPPKEHRPRKATSRFSISGLENQVKPKVLIVDDEDFFRKMIVLGFEREGFSVFQADNGEDAVSIAKKELPDLILLDLVMPRLLGFEVCQMLRNDEKFSKTAIIIMSAKSYKPDMDKAAELGADAYVVKPFELVDLMKTARENLHKRQNPK